MKKILIIALILVLFIGCHLSIFFSPTYAPKKTVTIQKNVKSDSIKKSGKSN